MSTRVKRGRALPARKNNHQPRAGLDPAIITPVIGLCLFGLLMVYDASVAVSAARYGHNFHFVTQQGISLILGLIAMLVLSRIDYHYWLKYSTYILGLGLIVLCLVFIPGLGVSLGGSTSWLKLGPVQFQPSYPLTIAVIIYLANWLPSQKIDLHSLQQGLVPFMAVIGLIAFIVAVPQGDLGTALIMSAVFIIMYFLAGARIVHFLLMAPMAALVGLVLVILEPYRIQRVLTFLGGGQVDSQNADWQVNQMLIALGSGGWTGQGLGQSRQKYSWLPVVESDSIFAVIGEELGYLGAVIVIAVMAYLIYHCLQVSQQAPDEGGRLIVAGVTILICLQVFVNLFAAVSIIPLTGIPLPFISSGGTSLMVLLAAIGIVLNVARQSKGSAELGLN